MTSHEGNYEIHSAYKCNEFSLYQYFKHPSSDQVPFPGFDCRKKKHFELLLWKEICIFSEWNAWDVGKALAKAVKL